MFQEIYKEKGQELRRIWGKYINREATTKEIELALKHMKKVVPPLSKPEKCKLDYLKTSFFHSSDWQTPRSLITHSAGKATGKQALVNILVGVSMGLGLWKAVWLCLSKLEMQNPGVPLWNECNRHACASVKCYMWKFVTLLSSIMLEKNSNVYQWGSD